MIAAIYARKSTDQNVSDEEKSVTRQIERARAYALAKGWLVEGHVYTDDGISGAEFRKRPGLNSLLAAIRSHPCPFRVLITMEPSRLGREQTETAVIVREILRAGVRLFTYSDGREITFDSALEKFTFNALNFVAEMERELARTRTRETMRRKAARGHVAGGKVYGYANREILGPSGKRDHVERAIVGSEAEVIRRIFREVAAGDGFCRIAKRLNAEGIPSPTRRGWAISGVRELVMRELYRGHQVYGRTRWEDRDGTKHKVQVPKADWLRVEVPALRIVDEELWLTAYRRLSDTRAVYLRFERGRLGGRPKGYVETPYLLTGFLRCAKCGGSVQAAKQPSRGTMMYYYRCATHRERGETRCPTGVRTRLERLEAAILGTIKRDVLAEEVLVAVIERTIARRVALATRSEARKAVIAGELAEVRVRIGRYVQALGDGVAIEEIRAQLHSCKLREQALLGELASLVPPGAPTLDRAKLRRRLEEWHGLLRQSPQVARQLLRRLLPEPIVLEPTSEGVRFHGRAAWGAVVAGSMQEVGLVVPPG